ncbi:type II toxin-antitoxin system RelE/ParE family toxin [bacterium]|nr:type II toxin-antitoxin system RelE/ParE family toxin [bacterium]
MEIKFTPTARSQFLNGLAHIKKDNSIAAKEFREKTENVLKRLVDFPESGKVVREYPDLPFREIVVAPYRFFYIVKADIIWIVAVWHSAQETQQPL